MTHRFAGQIEHAYQDFMRRVEGNQPGSILRSDFEEVAANLIRAVDDARVAELDAETKASAVPSEREKRALTDAVDQWNFNTVLTRIVIGSQGF